MTITNIKSLQQLQRIQSLLDQGEFDDSGIRPKLNITIELTY